MSTTIPSTYKAFRRTTGDLPRTILPSTEHLPHELGPHDVLLKIHAVSLNFRDVGMLHGRYPVDVIERGIPCSDAAAEVAATGSAVKDFTVGDHVSVVFDLNNLGPEDGDDEPPRVLGGDVDGTLAEYAVFEDKYLVQLPRHLSWEEAATIPCAGVTAWTALGGLKAAAPRSALLQGTGGVSLFALLICLAAGIQPIITSSSDKKLEDIRNQLGPDVVRTINYRTVSDQAAEVQRLTNGKGVDFVVNNTGPASIPQDISFLRQRGGLVSLVGFLEGFGGDWQPSAMMALMSKFAKLKGIAVGSKQDYVSLIQFLVDKKVSLAPLVDRVFAFDESPAAFDYLYSGSHVGKVIIKMQQD
ncbi:chaperonin 10-like protein [Sordaria sp. MPI-SDFR-AT-0083]|nr:chaperonin 10-like protein [Sordaria sp. MPI-SDFR-AT-0083]